MERNSKARGGSPHFKTRSREDSVDPPPLLLLNDERRARTVVTKMKRLTEEQEAVIEENIAQLLTQLNLTQSEHSCSITGNRHLALNSVKQYASVYRGLELFLKRIGDFMSLIMLRKQRPIEFCPSQSVDSLMSYVDYKAQKSRTSLVISPENCLDSSRMGLGRNRLLHQ